ADRAWLVRARRTGARESDPDGELLGDLGERPTVADLLVRKCWHVRAVEVDGEALGVGGADAPGGREGHLGWGGVGRVLTAPHGGEHADQDHVRAGHGWPIHEPKEQWSGRRRRHCRGPRLAGPGSAWSLCTVTTARALAHATPSPTRGSAF